MMWFTLLSFAHAQPPTVPEGFVFRPHFVTAESTYQAGSAFAVNEGSKTVIITAFHLFGPAGGLPAQLAPADLPKTVTEVRLAGLFSGKRVVGGKSGPALLIAEAEPMSTTAANDMAAFVWTAVGTEVVFPTSTEELLSPGTLSTTAAKKGDEVFIASAPISGATEGERVQKAVVVEANDKFLFFEYENGGIDLAGTSGSPVLNAKGEVVGLNLGGGLVEGDLIGTAAPLSAVRKHLQAAE